MLVLLLGFATVAGQLVRLALVGGPVISTANIEPIARMTARPDIVDRRGRLLATDVEMPSLYGDPALIVDLDEVIEKLTRTLPDLDAKSLRADLSNRAKRFVWLRRGLHPRDAQRVHDLGLPGIGFRQELRRVYTGGDGAGHVVGFVDVDNRGRSGIERHLDEQGLVDAVDSPVASRHSPVALSIDLAVEHALRSSLAGAITEHGATAAAGIVLDIRTGEVLALSSLPDYAPGDGAASLEEARFNRMLAGTFELGSVFKVVTLAMALDAGTATLASRYDATAPLAIDRFTIDDAHPERRWLTAEEVFLKSSNIGAARMALEAGDKRQRRFLARLGLLAPIQTEIGSTAAPQLPASWGKSSVMTIAFGHGLAVAPIGLVAATASILDGGRPVTPTFLRRTAGAGGGEGTIVSEATSQAMRSLFRDNVAGGAGTGGRADVPGYDVGGKTGTADIAGIGGYRDGAVLTSFLAAFPMRAPRYVTYVMLFEPKSSSPGGASAGLNAAPLTAKLIARVAPLLGLEPARGKAGRGL